MTLGRCPLSIFCSRGSSPREVPPNPESITGQVCFSLCFGRSSHKLISHKVLSKSFCKSQFPHRFVNLFFIPVIVKDALTDLCGNWLLQNDCINNCCEISMQPIKKGSWRGQSFFVFANRCVVLGARLATSRYTLA